MNTRTRPLLALLVLTAFAAASPARCEEPSDPAVMSFAPQVPPPIERRKPAVVRVDLVTEEKKGVLMAGLEKDTRYPFWTFNGHVPGPFIRVRVGDTLEVHLTNPKTSTMPHDIDLHAVTGPGGGARLTLALPGETKVARFKLLHPGLYVYHCAAPPVTYHIANGMYGLILVEPEDGLPKADKEFYVMQSEFYTKNPFGTEGLQAFSPEKAEREQPTYIVFNGRVGSLQSESALQAKTGDTIRVFFGNAGPNLASSFHVIGAVLDDLYPEGSLSTPMHGVQTTLVPAGGSAVADFKILVPGDYSLVDHSIFRTEKGAIGAIHADGPEAPEIYSAVKSVAAQN